MIDSEAGNPYKKQPSAQRGVRGRLYGVEAGRMQKAEAVSADVAAVGLQLLHIRQARRSNRLLKIMPWKLMAQKYNYFFYPPRKFSKRTKLSRIKKT